MTIYTAHATMRTGVALPVKVPALNAQEAHAAIFRLYPGVTSITAPRAT